jgi:hypothetical protein
MKWYVQAVSQLVHYLSTELCRSPDSPHFHVPTSMLPKSPSAEIMRQLEEGLSEYPQIFANGVYDFMLSVG